MPRLDPNLIMHHLSILLAIKAMKKKLQKMHPHVALLVKKILEKLLKAKLIREIDYAEWILNIIPISKHEKSIYICIEFHELNLACPKYDFPFPNINMIVDMMTAYEMYLLMDGFSSYN